MVRPIPEAELEAITAAIAAYPDGTAQWLSRQMQLGIEG